MFNKVNLRKTFIRGTINLLETMAEGRSPEENMAKKFSNDVMKDGELAFVIRTFKSKFELGMANAYVEPVISPGSLRIEKWRLAVNNHTIIEGAGVNDILDEMTELVLSRDPDRLRLMKIKLDKCC